MAFMAFPLFHIMTLKQPTLPRDLPFVPDTSSILCNTNQPLNSCMYTQYTSYQHATNNRPSRLHSPSSLLNNPLAFEQAPINIYPKCFKTTTFKCLVQNVRSITNKATIVEQYLVDNQIDIAVLTETWIKQSDPTYNTVWNELLPEGYRFFNQSRVGTRGGGVGIVFSKSVTTSQPLQLGSFSSFEYIAVKMCINTDEPFILLVIYRPPKTSLSIFLSQFDMIMSMCKSEYDNILVAGDFNLHLDNAQDSYACRLNVLLRELAIPIASPISPTRKCGHCLDLIATNLVFPAFDGSACKIIDNDISDHYSLCFSLNIRSK